MGLSQPAVSRSSAGEAGPRGGMVILCADDYALTEGVSRAIGELAAARRLSATSVLVTAAHWPELAPRLRVHRARLSIGLHLDLTLGPPAGPMPRLAPAGRLPGLRGLLVRALAGLLDAAEIGAEIDRQLDRLEAGLGFPPDHIDGHQHVHVLPGVRGPLLDIVRRRYGSRPPLVRLPADRPQAILERGLATWKALAVNGFSLGFGRSARARGLPVNDSFAGFSDFDVGVPYPRELERALLAPGRCHLVMCHPGHADAALAALDPVVARRRMEYDALMREPDLPDRIWRPARSADGPPVAWPTAAG